MGGGEQWGIVGILASAISALFAALTLSMRQRLTDRDTSHAESVKALKEAHAETIKALEARIAEAAAREQRLLGERNALLDAQAKLLEQAYQFTDLMREIKDAVTRKGRAT